MTSEYAYDDPRTYRFGAFTLIPDQQLLLNDQTPVRIGGRVLEMLTLLVERPGEVVTKRELLARAWPDSTVDEGSLKVNMVALRRTLQATPGTAPYIATVVGRGYRFVAPVSVSGTMRAPAEVLRDRRRHNLPASQTRVVGRADVIEAVDRDLQEARLVTIVGPGGVGKTTVAVACAQAILEAGTESAWLVDLAPIKDANLVASAIAAAIGLSAHSANMMSALCEYLRGRDMLLLFDSCESENIIDAVAECAFSILSEAPGVRILATSREPLRLKGERVKRLRGLALPPERPDLQTEEALSFGAVELFVDRAADRIEGFRLKDGEACVVAELCRRLDGLPLAIELVATRIDMFGIAGLLAQLDARVHLLMTKRAGPERHRTIRAAIDWSYDLLSPGQQMVMRRLAVFAGSFSLESACAVTMDETISREAAIDHVSELAEKSLLATDTRHEPPLFRLLDTTRAYALEKLVDAREVEASRWRHARHLLDIATAAGRDAQTMPRQVWLDLYGASIDDLRAATDWALTGSAHNALGIDLTVASIPIWRQFSLLEESRLAVTRALDERFDAVRTQREDLMLNLALGAALLHTRGPLLQVKSSLTAAFNIAEELRDKTLQLQCLRGLSEYELWTGDSHSAIAIAEKIRVIAGDSEGGARSDADAQAGSAMSWLGALAASRHRLEAILDQPLDFDLRSESARLDFDQRLTAQGALATVLWLQGFPDQAAAMARCQLAAAEESNFAVSHCYALLHGSLVVSLYLRDYDAARRFLVQGIDHAERHSLGIWRAMATCVETRLNLYTARPIDLEVNRSALLTVRESGFRVRYPNYLTNYGEALARTGDLRGGIRCIDEAIALSEANGQVVGIPEILRIKGNVLRFGGEGEFDAAAACYRRSLELARQGEATSWELRSAISLVELERTRAGDPAAEDALAEIYGRFSEGFASGDLRRARTLVETRQDVGGRRSQASAA